jgi:hypothetical protein
MDKLLKEQCAELEEWYLPIIDSKQDLIGRLQILTMGVEVENAVEPMNINGKSKEIVHYKITNEHRTRTDKLMAVLRKLPGVTFDKFHEYCITTEFSSDLMLQMRNDGGCQHKERVL